MNDFIFKLLIYYTDTTLVIILFMNFILLNWNWQGHRFFRNDIINIYLLPSMFYHNVINIIFYILIAICLLFIHHFPIYIYNHLYSIIPYSIIPTHYNTQPNRHPLSWIPKKATHTCKKP
jgi:hypothetical protein